MITRKLNILEKRYHYVALEVDFVILLTILIIFLIIYVAFERSVNRRRNHAIQTIKEIHQMHLQAKNLRSDNEKIPYIKDYESIISFIDTLDLDENLKEELKDDIKNILYLINLPPFEKVVYLRIWNKLIQEITFSNYNRDSSLDSIRKLIRELDKFKVLDPVHLLINDTRKLNEGSDKELDTKLNNLSLNDLESLLKYSKRRSLSE